MKRTNTRRSNQGKKPNTKRDFGNPDANESQSTTKYGKQKYNDAAWYVPKEQLAKDVASLSFNTALGNPQIITSPGIATAPITKINLPGIMSLYCAPAVGPSKDGTSVINIAAKNLYSYVRHQNSGHSNYDSPDLMLYILAMDSIYSMISWMQSLYGTAMVFSQKNRYIGDALLTAKGARAADIRNNLANFRAFINQYIVKASAFCVPNTMSLFKRHFWMYSNAFKDEPTTKSQLYVYNPAFLYQYNLDAQNVGFLDPIPVTCAHNSMTLEPKTCSLAEIMSVAEALLSQLQYSEDINIMSGDILKAYGRENLWNMDLIPENYGVFPVFSEEILDQIHNTVFVGRRPATGTASNPVFTMDTFNITQSTSIGDGAILYNPKFIQAIHLGWDQILDMHSEDPTPEEVLVGSRNMVAGKVTGTYTAQTKNNMTELTTCGSDMCLFADVWLYDTNGLQRILEYFESGAMTDTVDRILTLSKFNKYPRFYEFSSTDPGYNEAPIGVGGEIDNYTVVSSGDIDKIHQSAMLAMLGVPTLGLVR